jgi:hypothetical protein
MKENSGGAGWKLTGDELAAIDHAFPMPDNDTPLDTI